jgi:hypothetical protein
MSNGVVDAQIRCKPAYEGTVPSVNKRLGSSVNDFRTVVTAGPPGNLVAGQRPLSLGPIGVREWTGRRIRIGVRRRLKLSQGEFFRADLLTLIRNIDDIPKYPIQ